MRRFASDGFTLPEVLIAASISVMLTGFVVTLYVYGGRGFGRINWHGNINRQGNAACRLLSELLNSASPPAVVRSNQTLISEAQAHKIMLPSGLKISATPQRKLILSFAASSAARFTKPGEVIWNDVWLEPQNNGLAVLRLQQSRSIYSESDYASVTNPGSGAVRTLLNDLQQVSIAPGSTGGLQIEMTAVCPGSPQLSQTFVIRTRDGLPLATDLVKSS